MSDAAIDPASDRDAVRVLIVDDQPPFRLAARAVVESVDGFVVVDSVETAEVAIERIDDLQPDLVLMDLNLPGIDGVQASKQLRDTHPAMGVVVLSQFSEPVYALALLDRGSDRRAYLLKERVHNRAELMAAIRAVAAGGSMIDPKIVEALVRSRSQTGRSALDELTAREREVLSEIAQAKSNAAIAESLFLTKRAVEKHINSIFSKLHLTEERDVNRRVTAVLLYLAGRPARPGGDDRTDVGVPARFTPGD